MMKESEKAIWPTWVRISIVSFMIFAYVIAFFLLHRIEHSVKWLGLYILPLILLGWFWGTRAGLIGGIFGILSAGALLYILPVPFSLGDVFFSIFMYVAVGLAAGKLGSLKQQLTHEIVHSKQAEKAMRESEERYRTLFEKTTNPILIIDAQGDYIESNEAALQFLECAHDELLSKNIRDFIPPGKKKQVFEKHQPMWKSGGLVEA